MSGMTDPTPPPWRRAALWLAPAAAVLVWLSPAPWGLAEPAWRLVGLALWMVAWWLTEAVPLPVTALLPLAVAPLLGIQGEGDTAASYAHPLIFLFLGGFVLAAALERSGLHRRIALSLVHRLGAVGGGSGISAGGIVAGFMAASAFLSMWISNTATAMLMYTLGRSLLGSLEERLPDRPALVRFGIALMLGIAYACSIGGAGTLIGTPPNALMASFLSSTYGVEITMGRWLLLGLPFVLVMLPAAWWWLTRGAFRLADVDLGPARAHLEAERRQLGAPSRRERFVLVVFAATAAAWVLRGPLAAATGWPVTDTGIAMTAALVLLVVPLPGGGWKTAVDWPAVERLPWGVLILFGGGLALAGAFQSTGLAEALGRSVAGLEGVPPWLLLLAVTAGIVMLTELTSNTATAATFLPIVGAVAVGLGLPPALLCAPVALAASAAFMMPVATPPNAIVFAYEEMRIGHMARAGMVMNLAAVATITLLVLLLGTP